MRVICVICTSSLPKELPVPLIPTSAGKRLTGWNTLLRPEWRPFTMILRTNRGIEGIVRNRISLVGNINNPETLFSKGPEQVPSGGLQNLEAGVQLVGPECAIPLQIRLEKSEGNPKGSAGLARDKK